MTTKADIMGALGARRCQECQEVLGADNYARCDDCVRSAREVFGEALSMTMFEPQRHRNRGPGQVIAALSPEKRRRLEGLTADDINGMRDDHYKAFAEK